jgi:hypothetical protein
MVRVCRFGGRIVLLDLVAPSDAVRDQFDHVHRLIDPSHMRSFLAPELAELLPGGVDQLTSANMISVRLPIDVAITDQSDKARVLELLRAELEGVAPPTGFDPAEEDDKLVVSFATCVVHSVRY